MALKLTSKLKRLLRPLVGRRETRPLQSVLDPQSYGEQRHIGCFRTVWTETLDLQSSSSIDVKIHAGLDAAAISVEAPIHRLPAEVLGIIFVYTLDHLRDRRQWAPKVDDPHIILCGVCKRWRDVAISMPMLWSAFPAYSVGENNDMALYRLWLERTRGAPLVINFDTLGCDREFDAALTLFLSHSYQWADVTITLQPLTLAKLLEIQPENVPLLKKVHIRILAYEHRFTKEDAKKIISTLAPMPTLSDLSWDFHIPAHISSLTWPNLRKFATRMSVVTAECLELLSCLPQIEDIFFGNYVHCPIDIVSSPVAVENLHSLSIESCDDPAELFNALTLPSLNALLLPRPEDCSSLERLIDRSGCTLRHLTICAMGARYDHLLHELPSFLELKCFYFICSLRLTFMQLLTDQVAERLTWNSDDGSLTQLFPYLSTVEIARCDTTDGVFSRMIASRWKGRHRPYGLKRVELPQRFWKWGHRKTDIATLNCLKEQGLEIIRELY
ncbi:hypothetical protein J132_00744 [Termitomyces sp. J132]|nr:hypothetical protein J132_00744 [Termitomyces sp. J132]